MQKFLNKIESLGKKVYKQLSGLKEEDFQTALGIEFRNNKIDFMREAGLEVFYDNHPISLHELDFLIPTCMDLKEPIIIETKVSSGIAEDHRQQLRNYLRSAAKNDNAIIKKVKTGLVLNFKKNEVFTESVRQRKETQDIEIEVWTYEKNKFTQHYSNKKAEEKS